MMKLWFPPLIALMLLSAPLISQNQTFKNAIHAKINVVDYGIPSGNDFKMGQNFELAYLRNIARGVNIGVPLKLGLATLPGDSNRSRPAYQGLPACFRQNTGRIPKIFHRRPG